MTPDALLSLYQWKAGTCFRCAQGEVYVTPIGHINTPSGESYGLAACGACVLDLELERQRYADRKGFDYLPGTLGL
ncbi:hypothetical protein ABZ622_36315 [Streptomyces sp. NPDC007164]|uniref:hypothetical protein n=1 Tax=Streptomyces sp. NPDC007164 TaxID=3156918 RepID=UPI00340E2BA8